MGLDKFEGSEGNGKGRAEKGKSEGVGGDWEDRGTRRGRWRVTSSR